MAQYLTKRESYYNPYHVSVHSKVYEVKNIIFYKEDGTTIAVGSGWFGNNNNIPTLTIPDVLLRRAPKFDGQTFIIVQKRDWLDRNDRYPHAHVYIPFAYFDFEEKKKEENHGYFTDVFPHYVSRTVPGVEFVHYKGRTRVEDEPKKAYAEVLLGAINALEIELGKLNEEYKEYDHSESLKDATKDTPMINQGVASEVRETIRKVRQYKKVLESRGYNVK